MTGWTLLPAYALFALPVADTRSPSSSVTLRWNEGFAVDAAIGVNFPLVQWENANARVQAGVLAAAFLGFDPAGEITFDFETFDGIFALPVDLAVGEWAGRIQWGHTSAHFGDGARNNDDGDRPNIFDAYSREWIQLQGGRRLGPARVYGGVRGITHGTGRGAPLMVQIGGEGEGPWKLAPYAAIDLQIAGESAWKPALAGQLGGRVHVGGHRLRVGLAARTGPDDTGRLQSQEETYIGLILGFDTTGGLAERGVAAERRLDAGGGVASP